MGRTKNTKATEKICCLCDSYQYPKKILKPNRRLCSEGSETSEISEACNKFKPSHYIYCPRHNQRVAFEVCTSRMLNKLGYGCGKCRLKKALAEILKERES